MIADGTPVGDYHSWVRGPGADCPHCPCCTAVLCEVGAQALDGCAGCSSHSAQSIVAGCPCSSADTPGTARHALAVWHEHVQREEDADPGAAARLQEVLNERVWGPEVAQDPAKVGPRLRALIAELWPPEATGSS